MKRLQPVKHVRPTFSIVDMRLADPSGRAL